MLTRRKLLGGCAGAIALGCLLGLFSPLVAQDHSAAILARRLARLIGNRDSVARIGQAIDAPDDERMLLGLIVEGWGTSLDGLMALSDAELKHKVATHHCDDLRCGRINMADGWILSRTEALLYRLAATV